MTMMTPNSCLDQARIWAKKGNCKKRNYGCVIVSYDHKYVVGIGHTFSIKPCDKCKRRFSRKGHGYDKCTSIHAEQMAVSGVHIPTCSVAYLVCYDARTGEEVLDPRPCPTCTRILRQAGVTSVITPTEVISLI